mmetsp:Transcript_71115/g.179984  ORF Transcript_71115/g.179984 Transcript_71115/m.179984 type:complete len:208 (+) Transcript_71115:885-1508(+)
MCRRRPAACHTASPSSMPSVGQLGISQARASHGNIEAHVEPSSGMLRAVMVAMPPPSSGDLTVAISQRDIFGIQKSLSVASSASAYIGRSLMAPAPRNLSATPSPPLLPGARPSAPASARLLRRRREIGASMRTVSSAAGRTSWNCMFGAGTKRCDLPQTVQPVASQGHLAALTHFAMAASGFPPNGWSLGVTNQQCDSSPSSENQR